MPGVESIPAAPQSGPPLLFHLHRPGPARESVIRPGHRADGGMFHILYSCSRDAQCRRSSNTDFCPDRREYTTVKHQSVQTPFAHHLVKHPTYTLCVYVTVNRLQRATMAIPLSVNYARPAVRHFSARRPRPDSRTTRFVASSCIVSAVVLPFIPPAIESSRERSLGYPHHNK